MMSCELVSKFCIFVVWNSSDANLIRANLLWIGFKILYLCGLKQYLFAFWIKYPRCELVSKFCIFVVWNSNLIVFSRLLIVVNWFQNFVSLWSETVKKIMYTIVSELWIGFKILYLCGLKQSRGGMELCVHRCELVSKFCIFVVWNSWLVSY